MVGTREGDLSGAGVWPETEPRQTKDVTKNSRNFQTEQRNGILLKQRCAQYTVGTRETGLDKLPT